MSCLEVRDRLPEHVLGVLPDEESSDVERHLEWCAGCRKELAELSEGAELIPAAMALARPADSLEQRVVERIAEASGRTPSVSLSRRSRRTRSRSGRAGHGHPRVRALAAVALGAAVLAAASIGWGVNQRNKADDIAKRSRTTITDLERVLRETHGQPFEAQLFPAPGYQGSGTAVLISAPGRSALLIEIVPPQPDRHPYTVRMVSRSGGVVAAGELQPTEDRTLILLQWFASDLSNVRQVAVLDRSGRQVMSGPVHPFAAPSPAPQS